MFGFGKSAQQKSDEAYIVGLESENAALITRNKALLAEIANTGILLQSACDGRDIALRQNAHLEADNHRLSAELARLTTRGPGGRFVKVGAPKPNGTAAAVQGVSHQPI